PLRLLYRLFRQQSPLRPLHNHLSPCRQHQQFRPYGLLRPLQHRHSRRRKIRAGSRNRWCHPRPRLFRRRLLANQCRKGSKSAWTSPTNVCNETYSIGSFVSTTFSATPRPKINGSLNTRSACAVPSGGKPAGSTSMVPRSGPPYCFPGSAKGYVLLSRAITNRLRPPRLSRKIREIRVSTGPSRMPNSSTPSFVTR